MISRYKERELKWGKEFRLWQQRFYNSKQWRQVRDQVRDENNMRCQQCGKLIIGKSIVDHIEEVTPDNKEDHSVTLDKANLQLLCLRCHNTKTFTKETNFDLSNRKDVTLF